MSAAIDGRADYVVTGDRALLVLGAYDGIHILTPARFVAEVLKEG